ncbi:pentraxin fusion protein-like [Pristis pectinata]|uniref:pentraxin fusion protein-like n=1 Tax=Pristis pectinata TaxID=685728 RepID=UPI00223D89E0|nr:pentraxin fusion protein-like [Pristis pectinata]
MPGVKKRDETGADKRYRDPVNLAPSGRAIQSSTESWADADRAIDGNKNTDATQNSCAQTKDSSFPWWALDLEGSYSVSVVRITVRKDCCTERLLGAEIYITSSMKTEDGYSLCGTIYSIVGSTVTLNCGDVRGRYVFVTIPGHRRILTLCEVEVFGLKLPSLRGSVNLAIKGDADQSGTEYAARASRANDGDKSADGEQGSCTQTNQSSNPWWRVNLKETFVVSMIRITNRLDCCSDRIRGAEIRIGNSVQNYGNSNRLCATVQSVEQSYTFRCDGFTGRYVNIMIPGRNRILTLCEVEVFGTKLPSVEGAGRFKPALKHPLYIP